MALPITPTIAISDSAPAPGASRVTPTAQDIFSRCSYFRGLTEPAFPLAGPHGQAAAPLSICQIPWDRLPLDESDLRL